MHRKIFYLLLMLSLVPALLNAGTRGRIKGTVVDLQTGEALIGANIIVVGTSTGAATDVNGDFLLQNLEAGTYDVRASYLGYQSITLTGVRVNADLTTYIGFELPSEDVSVGTVTIVAKRPLINKDATNAVRLTTSEDIDALPVRGVNGILALQAGVTLQDGLITIRGGRNDEVGYYLEGVSVTDPYSGGTSITISQDALEEIQVQAGGYTAEFGGANAGIIRQQLKSGSSNYKASFEYQTDNFTFKSREDAYNGEKVLGTHSYGYNEMSAVLSGPLFDSRFKFFLNGRYFFQRDRTPQDLPGMDVGPVFDITTGDSVNLVSNAGPRRQNRESSYTLAGTITADFKPIMLRFSGTYTQRNRDPFEFNKNFDIVTRIREGEDIRSNGSFNAKLTHVLSPNMFYELSAGYMFTNRMTQDPYLKDNYWAYGDSVANADAGWIFQRSARDLAQQSGNGRYVNEYNPTVYGWGFDGPNEIAVSYFKRAQSSLTFSGNLNWMIGKVHTIKIGGEYKQQTIRNWALNLPDMRGLAQLLQQSLVDPQYAGLTEDEVKQRLLVLRGLDNFGFDFNGDEIDDGYLAPKKPVFASAFIQDRIEFEDIILNLGLRYDYIDIDNQELVDPTRPYLSVNPTTGEFLEEGWQDVSTFSAVSPRIGVSFPVTDKTVFHAQFGKFVQQTRLTDTYQGQDRISYEFRQSYFFGASARGRNIRPTRTTQYEVGFTQQLTDFMSFDVTGYYKDIKNQVFFYEERVSPESPLRNYLTLVNGDYATTKGVEIGLSMRRYNRLAMNASLSLQDARGTGSNPRSAQGIVGAPIENTVFYPKNISPLDFNQSVRANMNLDYRFGVDDGPAFLNEFGVSLLAKYSSGHPYTRGDGVIDLEGDTRGRYPVEPMNASVTPSTVQVDIRIDKTFHIVDAISANIYVRVVNLFDTKNAENVWLRTGTANDDGVLQDPRLVGGNINTWGEKYVEAYQQFIIGQQANYYLATGNQLFGAPRQIILGLRLEY